jgi:tRNA threonylcarbamoyladenosine biosynthesis protein TsaB
MSLILNIDTSAQQAAVSIAKDGNLMQVLQNPDQKEHASFLQPAIKKLLQEAQMTINDLDAVAVVNGPGSYTGLRVALASAKGLCYVAKKPLITIGTLPLMARAAIENINHYPSTVTRLCPMIDARRQEVFTAVYNLSLEEILRGQAMILSDESFVGVLLQETVLFFGTGAVKWQALVSNTNALFAGSFDTTAAMADLSNQMFIQQQFTDLAYSEPLYLKEFYTGN